MKILLSFYPDIKINQLSAHTATMFLSNDYDLFIDTNANPGSWNAQRKRGTLRTDLMLRGGRVPKDDVDKADALIKRYQDALVSWVMDVEEREKGGIKKDIEVLKWHKKHRSPPATPADPEESQEEEEEKPIFTAVEDSKNGMVEVDFKKEAAQRLEENLEEYLVLTKGPEKPINPALPEEPNLEEIQEAPGEEEEIQPEIRSIKPLLPPLPGPIISPLAYQEYKAKGLDIEVPNNYSMWISEKMCPLCSGCVYIQYFRDPEPVIVCGKCKTIYLYGDLDRLPARKIPEAAQDVKTQFTNNIIRHMDEAALQPGEDYDAKIEAKSKEIFEALNSEIRIAQAEAPESMDPDLLIRLSKIYENLEVLQLLQNCKARQDLRAVQEKELEKQERDTSVSDVTNEVYINKNGKGYSWRITARAADMEMAVRYALFANEMCKEILKKGDGDNES